MSSDQLHEITALEVAQKLKTGEKFTLLDVREAWELSYAYLTDPRLVNVPMSQIRRKLKEAFPPALQQPEAEIVVMCHHGVRSANVAIWMQENGWTNVKSLAGGIDAYATQVDPSVGFY